MLNRMRVAAFSQGRGTAPGEVVLKGSLFRDGAAISEVQPTSQTPLPVSHCKAKSKDGPGRTKARPP